jgi:hypothetical protein
MFMYVGNSTRWLKSESYADSSVDDGHRIVWANMETIVCAAVCNEDFET